MSPGLRIGLPNGTLLQDACGLLRDAGIATVQPEQFDEALLVQNGAMQFVKTRPTDVPVYVEMGACDGGIVGKDMLWEAAGDHYELVDLRFGACRLVLAAPEESLLGKGTWPPSLRVATKYPKAAHDFFDRIGVVAELIKLHGSIELAPATGLADAVLDITASGRTLRANRLVEVAEAGRAAARPFGKQGPLKTPAPQAEAPATPPRPAPPAP